MAAFCGPHGCIESRAPPLRRSSRQYQPATCAVCFEIESRHGSMSAIELSSSAPCRGSRRTTRNDPNTMHPPRTSNLVNRDLCTTGTNYGLANEASWRLVSGNEATRWRNFVRPDNKRPEMSALVCSNPRLSASQTRISASAGQNCLPTNSGQARAEPQPQPLPRGAREGVDSGDPVFRIMYIMFTADWQ